MAPVRAFFLLGVVATAVAGLVVLTRDAAPSETPATTRPSPDYSLTDAEAIAEFERLNDQLMLAYRERNIALAEDVFTSDSPMLPRVSKEIGTLLDSSVISLTDFSIRSIQVIDNRSTSIKLEVVQVIQPRFETEDGRDVTRGRDRETQRSEWTLHFDDARWLLHDATITRITR